jgi:subtilisin family serine protease
MQHVAVKLSFLLSLALATSASAASFKAGEVLVKFKDGISRTEMNELYRAVGVRDVRRFKGTMVGLEKFVLERGVEVTDAISRLQASSAVEYAQPNYLLHLFPQPRNRDDERFSLTRNGAWRGLCGIPGASFLPGCATETQTIRAEKPPLQDAPAEVDPPVADPQVAKMYGLNNVKAPQAWKVSRGNPNVIVAVIDTGVDYNHEDLSFNMWRNPNPSTADDVVGYDFAHDDGLPFDDHSHGTHTAGTVGAVGGNGKGISGVSQLVSIMALKFIEANGSGTTENAIRAIDYAITHGAKVMSNSWGGEADDDNHALYEAIQRAEENDVLFVAAAGNGGRDSVGDDNDSSEEKSFPAAFDNPNIISVAATDEKDDLPFFSNYGANSVHLGAPGVNILSTVPGNRYKANSGTSMACPHVAGAAALVWAMDKSLSYQRVKEILLDSVDPIPALEGKTVTGGRLNVAKALRSME